MIVFHSIIQIDKLMIQVKQIIELEKGQSSYRNLMLEEAVIEKNYHNMCSLSMRLVFLCFSTFYFGYCLVYLSTFSTTTLTVVYGSLAGQPRFFGILVGVLPIGAIAGAGTAPFLMKLFSRRIMILVINAGAIIIEGILQIPNIYVLLVCRVFQGIFVGYYLAIVPIYINQITPKKIVGSFGVFTQLSIILGIIVSYGLGLILTALNASPFVFYRIMEFFNFIVIIVQSVMFLINYIPQSPNSLIKKNRNQEAKAVIAMFTIPSQVQKVFKQKQMEVDVQLKMEMGSKEQESQNKIKYSFKAYLLGFQLPFMQQMTGINAIVTQATTIVGSNPSMTGFSPYVSIVINSFQFLAALSTVAILSKAGRKPLILLGNLGLGLTDFGIGILLIFSSWSPSGVFTLVLLIIYMIIFGLSVGPAIWLYVPEIIPAKIFPLATMTNWFGCALCIIFTPMAIEANNGNAYPLFFFFGGLTLLFFIMNMFLMVETKGKNAQQIAISFNKQK